MYSANLGQPNPGLPSPLGATGGGAPPPGGITPPPGGGALPGGPLGAAAEAVHRQKADAFVRDAIKGFLHGEITRAQLAEALSDDGAYSYAEWKKENVVHPSRAVAAGVAQEPEPPVSPMLSPAAGGPV